MFPILKASPELINLTGATGKGGVRCAGTGATAASREGTVSCRRPLAVGLRPGEPWWPSQSLLWGETLLTPPSLTHTLALSSPPAPARLPRSLPATAACSPVLLLSPLSTQLASKAWLLSASPLDCLESKCPVVFSLDRAARKEAPLIPVIFPPRPFASLHAPFLSSLLPPPPPLAPFHSSAFPFLNHPLASSVSP